MRFHPTAHAGAATTRWRRLLAAATLLALQSACGAPAKSAGQVGHLFQSDVLSLQDKVSAMCASLSSNSSEPNLRDFTVQLQGCANAGSAAQNYNEIDSFQFLGLDGAVPPKEDVAVIKKGVRGQLWVNRSLLSMATTLARQFKVGTPTGSLMPPDSGKAISGLIKVDIDVFEPFSFEDSVLRGGMAVKATGIAALDNRVAVRGGLINGGFVATLRTLEDQVIEKSLIKSLEAVVLVMPYAGDIYVDVYLDIEMHNLGMTGLFRDVLNGFLSTSFKNFADYLLSV